MIEDDEVDFFNVQNENTVVLFSLYFSAYTLVERNEVPCNNIKTFSECEAAAKQLGLSDMTATDDGQNGFDRDPPYCYFESDTLKFNYGGTNTGLCGSNNDKCLCYTQSPPSTTLPPTAPPVRQCSSSCKELLSFSLNWHYSQDYRPSSVANLEEVGDYFEGDMILPEELTKVHTSNPARKWPSGVVPYVIEGSFSK